MYRVGLMFDVGLKQRFRERVHVNSLPEGGLFQRFSSRVSTVGLGLLARGPKWRRINSNGRAVVRVEAI